MSSWIYKGKIYETFKVDWDYIINSPYGLINTIYSKYRCNIESDPLLMLYIHKWNKLYYSEEIQKYRNTYKFKLQDIYSGKIVWYTGDDVEVVTLWVDNRDKSIYYLDVLWYNLCFLKAGVDNLGEGVPYVLYDKLPKWISFNDDIPKQNVPVFVKDDTEFPMCGYNENNEMIKIVSGTGTFRKIEDCKKYGYKWCYTYKIGENA